MATDNQRLVTLAAFKNGVKDFVTGSALATALSGYVTSSSLAATLANYVTSSALTAKNYATVAALSLYAMDGGNRRELATAVDDHVINFAIGGRAGNNVNIYFDLKIGTVAANATIVGNVPLGYRPGVTDRYILAYGGNGTMFLFGINGSIKCYNAVAGATYRINASWNTKDAIPATLPGTPA